MVQPINYFPSLINSRVCSGVVSLQSYNTLQTTAQVSACSEEQSKTGSKNILPILSCWLSVLALRFFTECAKCIPKRVDNKRAPKTKNGRENASGKSSPSGCSTTAKIMVLVNKDVKSAFQPNLFLSCNFWNLFKTTFSKKMLIKIPEMVNLVTGGLFLFLQ